MWSALKQSVTELMRARAGRRFRARYRSHRVRRRESYLVTFLYAALGLVAVALGVAFSFWPVVPGFVFVLGGLALLSARSQWLAHRLDRLELVGRRFLLRGWLRRNAPGNSETAPGADQDRSRDAGAPCRHSLPSRGAGDE